jgi:pyocin large subunit-like protein
VRGDGVITRFDKKSGTFLAFNENRTIRTFFKPDDGVRYFERQLDREH